MWRLADPKMLWLLLVLPAVLWFVYRRRPGPAMVYPLVGHVPRTPLTARHLAVIAGRPVFTAGIALMILALARPQKLLSRVSIESDAVAIQMAIDVSGSMAGLDFSNPEDIRNGIFRTRLDVVKDVFADFVHRRPSDLIGLITFGGYAISRAPLTFDHDLLLHLLADIEIPGSQYDRFGQPINPEDSMTAIGDALALACARMNDTNMASRIVVFLSDGESNFGIIQPEEAIQIARSLGIKVYTIGVGREGPVPFIGRDLLGRHVIQQADIGMDIELLQRMAEETGGHYFHVEDPAGLSQAMNAIDRLEKTTAEQQVYELYREKLLWPLLIGLLLACGAATTLYGITGKPV